MSQQPTILVVEDDVNLNHAITLKLKSKGVNVISVLQAEEALQILENGKQQVDFVWLDLLLPGMSGMDFLRKLKEDKNIPKHPVAVVSVSGGIETQEEARKLGAVDFLVKSEYKLEDLANKILAKVKKVD